MQGGSTGGGPTKAIHNLNNNRKANDEDTYSDSFEEINQDIDQDSLDNERVVQDNDDLQYFLRTAT